MKTLSLLLLALSFTSAYAETTVISSTETYFDKLEKMFNAGEMPSATKIKGSWAGRCFASKAKNTANGAGLIIRGVKATPIDRDAGPISDVNPAHLAITSFTSENATAYDNVNNWASSAPENGFSALIPTPESNAFISTGKNPVDEKIDITFLVRTYDKWIIKKSIASSGEKKVTFNMCYYFIPELK